MFWENSYPASLIPHLLGYGYLVYHSNWKKMQTRQVFNDCNRPDQYIEWKRQYHGQNKLYAFTDTKKKLEVPRIEQVNIDYRKPGQPRWLHLDCLLLPTPRYSQEAGVVVRGPEKRWAQPLLGASWVIKNPPANAGDIRDASSIPGLERSPGGGHGNPLQYSYLENPMDRGARQATVHSVAESWTGLKWLSMQARPLLVLVRAESRALLAERIAHVAGPGSA